MNLFDIQTLDKSDTCFQIKNLIKRGTWPAQSLEPVTLNLRVMNSRPMLGVEPT